MILMSHDDISETSGSSFDAYPATLHKSALANDVKNQNSPRSIKRVSFQESANKYYKETWRTAEDCALQWYDYDDYRNFKHNNIDLIQQVKASLHQPTSRRNLQETFPFALRKLYTTIRAASYSQIDTLEDALSTPGNFRKMQSLYCSAKDVEDGHSSNVTMNHAGCPSPFSRLDLIGLEFKLVTILKEDNRFFRQQSRQQVLGAQAECRDGFWPEDEWDAVIAEASRNESAPLALFAQLLANAQYFGN